MSNKKLRTLDEIKKELKEPKHDYIEKLAKISDDKKSLILRIPQDIRNLFKIKKGDKLRFYSELREDRKPKLVIELIKKDA